MLNSFKKIIYPVLPFIPKVNLYIGRKLYSWKVRNSRSSIKLSLADSKSVYANIGSGAVGLPYGWVNIDFSPSVNVHYVFDCSKELPFATNSVRGLFTEHFFEHLDFKNEVPEFLKEVYRVLEPNGCVRIIVPDAEKYLLGYCSHDWELLKQTRPLDDDLNDLIMGYRYNTKMELINEVFRQDGEHKYAWDFLTMEHVLKRAGFTQVLKQSYLNTYDKTLAIDMEARRHESLYVEAIK